MTDINYQLASLRAALLQDEELLAEIHPAHDRAGIVERIEKRKSNIKSLEDWQKAQEVIRAGMV